MAIPTRMGLRDPSFASKWGMDAVLVRMPGQWYRYFSCAFVHPDWWSYAINALMLYWFGSMLETNFHPGVFLAIYGISLGLGNWLQARIGSGIGTSFLGSTAGTSGLFFACLLLFPGMRILGLPTWLFAMLYFIIALNKPCIGGVCLMTLRIADLFGSAAGLAAGLALNPTIAITHPLHTPYLIALTSAFIWYQLRNPHNLPLEQVFRMPTRAARAKRTVPEESMPSDEEVDRLLDKISKEGLQSLSEKERSFLEKASKQRRG
jgi:membrane associated rhomboid family serine protease